jgi:hypothetical protein
MVRHREAEVRYIEHEVQLFTNGRNMTPHGGPARVVGGFFGGA